MKRHAFRWTIVALATLLLSAPAFAMPVTDDEAATAAASLVAAGGAMDAQLGGGVSEVRALTPPDGATPFRVVKFAEGGFIVTSGDTEDDPFVFISDGPGDVVEDNENPLWGILRQNMSANEAVRATNVTARSRGVRTQAVSTAENKWAKWLSGGNGRARPRAAAVPTTSISDICVPRIMDIRWNQRGSGNAPHYYNDAIPHHCAVGCVAVAMAQVIRHYQWPASIGKVQKRCTVWNGQHGDASQEESVLLTTSGDTYNWSAMPAAPDLYANPPGQTEVSGFLYDAGITVKMNWHAPDNDTSEDGGSGGSSIRTAAEALHDIWGYTNAVWSLHGAVVPDEDPPSAGDKAVIQKVKDVYLPCLAAGMPVIASITGHDVVADGYGYSDETLYFHINYGWGGTNSSSAVTKNTGWYVATLPIQGHETGISSSIYNISTNAVFSLFSGRVHATDGSPLGNHPVIAVGTNGVRHTTRSNAAGVYVFNLQPGSYVVFTTNGNEIAYGEVTTGKNKSSPDGFAPGSIGNVSGVDLHLVQRLEHFSFWTGAGDGTSFGDPGNWEPAQVPAPGTTIVFLPDGNGVPPTTLNNDLAASAFHSTEIVFMPHSPCYTVTNNPISGLSAIVNNSSATNVFKVAVTFAGDIDVTGRVAFTDGGSANGAKPVNHTEFLGLYNLADTNWMPVAGATIPSNTVVNMQSWLIQTWTNNLTIRRGGTLNIAGDLVMIYDIPGYAALMSIARTIDGRINIGGWLKALEGAGGSPCSSGGGTIRAYGIYNDSRYGSFRLCNSSYFDAVHWEIGAGGLATGPNLRGYTGYSCSISLGDGVEIKALADFHVQGNFYMTNPILLDTNGHTIMFEGLISSGTTLTVAGGGTARVAYDARNIDLSGERMNVKVNVETNTTLALDSGSLLTTNQVTVAEGATLALTLSDPAVGATLGKLSMAAGSTLAVSNCTGAAFPPLDIQSFEKTGEGQIFVRITGPAPANGRVLLADGFAGASADSFACVECNVLPSGAQNSFDLSDGRLIYGTAEVDCVWNGLKANWGDAAAWRNTSSGLNMTWSDMNNAVFTAPAQVVLAADASAIGVSFAADASIVGDGLLSTYTIFVSPGATASISVPLSSSIVKEGGGVLALSRDREGKETILSEGTLRFIDGGDIGSFVFGTDPAKKVALDYGGCSLATPLLTDLLRVGMDETLTNGVFGTGTNSFTLTEANLPAVLTIAKGAVLSNEQHKISLTDGSTRVINIAGGKMYNTKNNNHWLMQASPRGRLDINLTDGGLLEYWYELYALTCRDGTGYVDPSLHITMKDSTFRITNNKSFRFGWDANNKNAVSPVGVFAATNSVFEGYGFFLGNDKIETNTAGSYTADFEGSIVSARQFRVFHDRPCNAVRFSNTRLVLTANDTKWLTAADEFNSVWHVDPITVGEGGLVMDSNGKNGSLVANLQGQGAVTKAGSGTLTVSRNQMGAGPFVCQAGTTLLEPGLTVTRPITVKDTATLEVNGATKVSLGGLALEGGATLNITGSAANVAPMSVSALTFPTNGWATLQKDGGPFTVGTYAILENPGITAEQVQAAQRSLRPDIEVTLSFSYAVDNNVLKLVVTYSGFTYVDAVAPTCETSGNIAYLRDDDGKIYKVGTFAETSWAEVYRAPLGHQWGEWNVATPASLASPGEERRYCTRSGCDAYETRDIPILRHSTFTVTPSGNTFIVTRSETNAAECVLYRTVSLSAYAGQHFTETTNTLSFAVGERDKYVTITEKAPTTDAYKFQTGTTRTYRFEVTDMGGFPFENAYADRTMTTGTSVPNSGAFNKKDLNASTSSELTITDSGYASNPGTTVSASSFFSATAPRDWFVQIGAELRTTVDFKVREKNNGYQYVQILADVITSCDNRSNCSDGDPGNINLSRYMAGFDHEPSKKNGNYAVYSFPVTNRANNCSEVENAWNNGVANKLYTQKFNTGCRAGDGRLIFPPNVTNFVMRFNASGGGTDHDEWCVTNVVMHIQAVDGNRPTKRTVSVAPGRHSRGNNVYVSVAFSEIVVKSGTPYLETTWGRLNYIAGSGSNVLTFSGKIKDDATLPLSISSISGTIKDLAGNSFTGSVTANEICALDESYAYPITYKLSGGNVATPNPASYTYDDATITFANPVRKGYVFDGWSGTGIDGLTNEVVIAHHSHGDRAYAAHWTMIPLPPYLDNAADEVLSNYDDWAAKYGYDPAGEHEAAFLLDVAPEAIANGVTPLVITELSTTNVVVEGSIYEMFFQEFMMLAPETLPCRRIVLASGAGALKPGPWREYNGMGGYGMDICNGYVVLRFGTDLSQPKSEWWCMSWFVDFEGDRAVVTIPEMSLENARRTIEDATGRTTGGLFLSVGIATRMAFDEETVFLIWGGDF